MGWVDGIAWMDGRRASLVAGLARVSDSRYNDSATPRQPCFLQLQYTLLLLHLIVHALHRRSWLILLLPGDQLHK